MNELVLGLIGSVVVVLIAYVLAVKQSRRD